MSTTDPADELRRLYPTILTTAHVAEMMHCTIGDVRDKVHSKELPAMRWGQQFRFFREEVITTMRRVSDPDSEEDSEKTMTGGTMDYERWYPDVPAVMDSRQLAALLHTNEQIVRAWVREGIVPAHRKPGGRKFTFLRHEIFDWLVSNRYEPGAE